MEEANGTKALAMELVEGEDLSERIARGPIPVDEALPIALQIAEALEDAHEKGIIHRDLKPANIKLTREGKVKILDFGLAKALEEERTQEEISNSPTLTMQATQAGIILGTAAYMSPEQAKGKAVDRRADIWAFGAVRYEMLTGKRAFEGGDLSEVMAAVIMKEVDLDTLPGIAPRSIRRLIARCLARDTRKRLQHMGEARIVIEEYLAGGVEDSVPEAINLAPIQPLWRGLIPWALAAVSTIALLIALWTPWETPPELKPPLRLSVELGADVALESSLAAAAILSPDESMLAFLGRPEGGQRQLYLRRLDQLEATPLSGTERALQPCFSPDGQWIAFWADDQLKRVSVKGGAAITLCDAPVSRGIVWSDDGSIVFAASTGEGLSRISSAGGTPEVLTTLGEGEQTHRWPQTLPGGRAVLFTVQSSASEAEIVVQRLPDGERKTIWQGGYFAHYLDSGHLVYIHEGTVFAAPFDTDRLEMTGEPSPVLEGIAFSSDNGWAQFAVSKKGTLIYVLGSGWSDRTLIWVDRDGVAEPIELAPRRYDQPRLSQDGRLLALQVEGDIWVYDLVRGTTTQVTFEGGSRPAWTPDGKRIVFTHPSGLFMATIDGSSEPQRLTENGLHHSHAVSPDGKTLLFHAHQALEDILTLELDGQSEAQSWLATAFSEAGTAFSPDGKWIVYRSVESGTSEIYVRPFPGPGGRAKVSTGGGDQPLWKESGEIFYVQGDRMMAVEIRTEPDLTMGRQRELFEGQYVYGTAGPFASYDVTPDGQRFVMVKEVGQTGETRQKIVLVLNWFEELKRLVPTE